MKLGVPKVFDLIADPTEEYGATLTPNGWVGGPMMKTIGEFGASEVSTDHARDVGAIQAASVIYQCPVRGERELPLLADFRRWHDLT